MAVVDQRWSDGPARTAPPAAFDRQPPQDQAAEQSVLGGMLMSKDAVADVLEALTSADFYKPAHALIFDAILDLYSRGEPADTVTVSAELERAGTLGRVGGAVYLHTLMASVPTAANAGFYARIVAEKAILRRLVEAGTRIVQLGYGGNDGDMGGGEVDEIVDRAQAEIYDVTERRTSEDYVVLEELLQPTMDEIDAIAAQGGRSAGVPTGFADLDNLTNGFHPGQMIIVAARPGIGKALALDTPLVTPDGWTTMGRVSVGDRLMGADGCPTTVVAATEVMVGRPCFEVEFSDGEVIVADAEHQWPTWDAADRRRLDRQRGARFGWPLGARAVGPDGSRTRTTADLACGIYDGPRLNHCVPTCGPLATPERTLPLDPWVLGYLLGADGADGADAPGTVGCEPVDREWVMKEFDRLGHHVRPGRRADRFEVVGLEDTWLELDLHRRAQVPTAYLRAAAEQRAALVQGLMDRAGDVDLHGRYRWSTTNIELACGVRELLSAQGCATTMHRRYLSHEGRPRPPVWEIVVRSRSGLTRLPRKVCSVDTEWHRDHESHFVVDVRPVPSVPVRCVQVDNADHLYLAGRAMVPTHNSTLALDIARHASVKHHLTSAIFSLEMSKNEITMRLLSAEAGIRLSHMRAGTMSEQDWQKIVRRMSEISDAPLYIDDSPNMTMMEIRAKARRLKQRHDLKLVVLDYLQLMTSGKRVESRQQEVSEFSRQMKLLAKELEVPVIAISQLNRGPEQRTDKRPMLSDLRESGSLEQDADMVIMVHRPDAWEADDPRAGEADLIIAKHRNGPTTTIAVAHQLHYSRFADLAG
ncbi:replicative DNA helicase [Nakamurella sp.]|uniref:replicative DNA helicase n=1 Tax=Nakamurella sp. TaxID=1869182 RepID=UPI0037833A2B